MKKRTLGLVLAASTMMSLILGSTAVQAAEAKDVSELIVGELHYSVTEDGGFAQALHAGVVSACENLGIDTETNLLTMENISEEDPSLIEIAVEELVDNGANIIFGCSTGYASVLAELQEDFPDVIFAQYNNDVYENIVEFQIRGYEGMFQAGYLCALMNEGSNELGFEASMDDASVRTAINAYALGAKYANPDATVQVLWADSWYDLDIEANNAKSLIDSGIKYMGMEASSPAVPQTCEENGAYCVGYNVDMEASAPGAVLTSFTWNWTPIFEDILQKTADGTIDIADDYYEGGECSVLADFNDDLVPEEIQEKVLAVKEMIANGEINIYGGELKDDEGNVLVAEGETMADADILAQNFFVENVKGGK